MSCAPPVTGGRRTHNHEPGSINRFIFFLFRCPCVEGAVKGCLDEKATRVVIVAEAGFSLVLTYALSGSGLAIGLELDTPVTDISLGSAQLDASHPSVHLGGSFGFGVNAEVSLGFDVGASELTVEYDFSAPGIGEVKGRKTLSV